MVVCLFIPKSWQEICDKYILYFFIKILNL